MANPYANAPPLATSGTSKSLGAKDPLDGWLSRHIHAKQVLEAMVGSLAVSLCGSMAHMRSGGKHQSVHEKSALCAVQEDSGIPQDPADLRADGRISKDGRCVR